MIDHFACWLDLPWAVIDVETTGFSAEYSKIVELAVVRMQHGKVLRSWSSLINPGIYIPREATSVHGIDNNDTKGSPRFVETLTSFVPLLANALPVAYSARFDQAFLITEAMALGFDNMPNPAMTSGWVWADPCSWVRSLDRFVEEGKASNTLEAACARWGIEFTGDRHRALSDARAAGELLWAMSPEIGRMTVSEMLRKQSLLGSKKGKK